MPQIYDIFNVTEKEIHGMTGEEFEDLVGDFYKLHGFEVFPTPKTNDYGADLILKTASGIICVQTKRQTSNVGIKAVQEVYASMAKYGGAAGVVITTAGFSSQAIELAKYCGIRLINGTQFWKYATDVQNKKYIYEEKENLLKEHKEFLKHREDYIQYVETLKDYKNQLENFIMDLKNNTIQNESKNSIIEKYYNYITEKYHEILSISSEFIGNNNNVKEIAKQYKSSEETLLNLISKYAIEREQNTKLNVELCELTKEFKKFNNRFDFSKKILYTIITILTIGVIYAITI